jgi:hypothetical protein
MAISALGCVVDSPLKKNQHEVKYFQLLVYTTAY